MRILISGAGIGGLTLAYWLRVYGFAPTLVDKAVEGSKAGYSMMITGHALAVLSKMGLEDEVERHRIRVNKVSVLDMSGRVVRTDDISDLSASGQLGLLLTRADLYLMIYNRVRTGLNLHWKRTIKTISQDRDGVKVTFDDGESEAYDLVIGADGVHSQVRRLVFGEGYETVGDVAYAAFIADNKYQLPRQTYHMTGPGRSVGLTGFTAETMAGIFWCRTLQETSERLRKQPEYLLHQFRDFGWIVPDVIRDVKVLSAIFCDYNTQVRLPSWHKDRVVLVGDAAYCLSPLSTRGAAMATLGAYVLAKALREAADYRTAFVRYEDKLHHGIEMLQDDALRVIPIMLPKSQIWD